VQFKVIFLAMLSFCFIAMEYIITFEQFFAVIAWKLNF